MQDLIRRADVMAEVRRALDRENDKANKLARIQHADVYKDDIIRYRGRCYGYADSMKIIDSVPSADAVSREEYNSLKEAFEMILIYERCGGSVEQTYCPMAEKTCSKPNDISWCATCYDITEKQRHMAKNALLRRMEVDERINRRAEEGKAK